MGVFVALMFLVGGIGFGADLAKSKLDIFIFPYYEGNFNPAVLKAWKQKIFFCPSGGDDRHVEFENPETGDIVFGVFWTVESEHFLIAYWYEENFYDYYFLYDSKYTYRFYKKEITDEIGVKVK